MTEKLAITEESGEYKGWYGEAKRMTLAELPEFLRGLTEDYSHDYGTICHALAAGAVATAYAMNHTAAGGITGFQAGAVMWEFITHWNYQEGDCLRIIDYKNMLYPQYDDSFNSISTETWEWLQREARKNLAEKGEGAAPEVIQHWQSIANGVIPFGYALSR